MMEKVRVKFLRGTSLGGGIDAAPGDVVELDRRLYAVFLQQGRCLKVDAELALKESVQASVESAAVPEPDVKPARKGKKHA